MASAPGAFLEFHPRPSALTPAVRSRIRWGVNGLPTFRELCELEPRLADLEAEAMGTADDQTRSYYCSNFVWLPMYTRLRTLLGAYRRTPGRAPDGVAGHAEQPIDGPLLDSHNFESAFVHLSKMLPPCRDCGCVTFQEALAATLTEG